MKYENGLGPQVAKTAPVLHSTPAHCSVLYLNPALFIN